MLGRLRARLTLLAASLTGAVLVVALGVAYGITREQYRQSRAAAFTAAVAQVQYQWTTYDQLSDSWLTETEQANGFSLQLLENGQPLLFSMRHDPQQAELFDAVAAEAAAHGVDGSARPIESLTAQQADFKMSFGEQTYRCAVRITASDAGGWRSLAAVQPTKAESEYLTRLAWRFFALGIAGCLVIAALCWYVAGRAIRPVAAAMEQQRRFLSDAGHELRTPLAVIRANVGAAEAAPEKAPQYLAAIDSESARMGSLVDDLLLLTAGASAKERLDLQELAPDTFLLQFAEKMEPMAAVRGRTLKTELPPRAVPPVRADDYRLRQLMTILLDNALRYEPEGGVVVLRLCAARGAVRFAVIDHGPGIQASEKSRVFARYYRAPETGQAPAGHYGLGLSVAQELCDLHGGRLRVEDTPGGGATFVLELRSISV